jgi:hypothetical protein
MDGYVIVLEHDDDSSTPAYWASSATTNNLDDVAFYSDIVAARQAAGTLQNQFTDRTVKIVPASKGIQLNPPPPTPTTLM